MKLSWRYELPQLLLIAGMFAAAAWAWPQLSERLPIHWNLQGEVDGWGNKFMGLLFFPCVMLGVYLLLLVVPFIDPGKANYQNFQRSYGIIRIAFMAFMTAFYAAILVAAFGRTVNMTMVILPLLGILFIVLGNFLGKIRPNWFVGVRTPWTLSSRLSWNKTHRLAGWLFMLMGLLFIVLTFKPSWWMFATVLAIDAACIIWMVVYSYIVYRSDPQRTSPAGTSPGGE
jgi:uncharacterized membrane protein